MSADTFTGRATIDLGDVPAGAIVRVTVDRRYGEEQECADSWVAEVLEVDTAGDRLRVRQMLSGESRWVSRLGGNPGGVDPARTATDVVVQAKGIWPDAGAHSWLGITNAHPAAVEAARQVAINRAGSAVYALVSKVRTVSYGGRDLLSGELRDAVDALMREVGAQVR